MLYTFLLNKSTNEEEGMKDNNGNKTKCLLISRYWTNSIFDNKWANEDDKITDYK